MNKYEDLFEKYLIDLDSAVSFEENKLDNIRENLSKQGKSETEINEFIRNNFDPICCSGRVIAVFREYWLKCAEINDYYKNKQIDNYVNPKDFTVDWLSSNGNPYQLYDIIQHIPYYPIGIDENGNYC